jgi:hypothetical protein
MNNSFEKSFFATMFDFLRSSRNCIVLVEKMIGILYRTANIIL